jgi:hypothetical protein
MTGEPANSNPARVVVCARCGASFGCDLSGECWCAHETFRLPIPTDAASDCLCPVCLRAAAALPEPYTG